MRTYRFLLVLVVLATNLSCRSGGEPALIQRTEARRLVSDMRINFAKASDASNRAVMADTDEDSIKFAREAEAAIEAVSAAIPTLARHLSGLAYPGNADQLARFQERFESYRTLDRKILKLAIENTNLKAQHLLFGPISQAANELCGALESLGSIVPAGPHRPLNDAAVRAQLAVREIQVLQAPHIAEARDPEMDRIEQQIALRQAIVREGLLSIEKNGHPPMPALKAAKVSFEAFETLTSKLIALSRQNTNVRSLELAMRQKPTLTSACDAHLVSLQDALAAQGFSGTR